MTDVLLFRIRVLIVVHRPVRLHAIHSPVIYALLCEANARGQQIKPAIPDGLLLDAPEQCRTELRPGDEYAFGFSLLASSPAYAAARIYALETGLRSIGESGLKDSCLGGNYSVRYLQDLVSGQILASGSAPAALPLERLLGEVESLADHSSLTLNFTSPLRTQRLEPDREKGHYYCDRQWCDAALIARRLQVRQSQLGWTPPRSLFGNQELSTAACSTLENRLVWLDVSYGPAADRTSLGGSLGKLRLQVQDPLVIPTLVWGQYVGVGGNTRFGFGRYRIAELGPDPTACHRSSSLLSLAFRPPHPDAAAARYHLESGVLSERIRGVLSDNWHPDPLSVIPIQQGEKQRLLTVPSRIDRALQRCVVELLTPAIDRLLESSSFAWRRGLSRESAAQRIRQLWQEGWHWALKADFSSFFDSIPHSDLHDHIEAVLQDPALTAVVLAWTTINVTHAPNAVQNSAAASSGRGIPTGAVLSPLLANLFLDAFDEHIAASDRRLVRYADDMLILFREKQQAEQVFEEARQAANALSLTLQQHKTRILDLHEPFSFLGFQFFPQRNWQAEPGSGPARIDELGWHDAGSPREHLPLEIRLPGEQPAAASSDKSTIILGPGVARLDLRNGCLAYRFAQSGQLLISRSLERVRQLVVLGTPTVSHQFLKAVRRQQLLVTLVDPGGRDSLLISNDYPEPRPDLLRRQLQVAADPTGRLLIAKQLVLAKVRNYACLAQQTAVSISDTGVAATLLQHLPQITACTSMEQLLGLEGAAARDWYRLLPARLGNGFRFERRIAPNAADPVNVMLNIAQSILYRQTTIWLQQEGFCTAVGLLHTERAGHHALASDLQEPFRHLMERVVIEASRQLQPGDFMTARRGPWKLVIRPHALKRLLAVVHRVFALPVIALNDESPADYRLQILRTIRSLRRHLTWDHEDFRPFTQLSESGPTTDEPIPGSL